MFLSLNKTRQRISTVNDNPTGRDRLLGILLRLATTLVAAVLVGILGFLVLESWPIIASGEWLGFIRDHGWYPTENSFGLLPMIAASLVIMLGASLLALCFGLASALFIQFYAGPVAARLYRWTIHLLGGIPSVVFGLWGLTQLVPLIVAWRPPGTSLVAAIIVLALMILPTITLTIAAAFSGIPKTYGDVAAALGIRRSTTILSIMLPAAAVGIRSGVVLGMARAIGETMAVLMVAGNVVQFPVGLFEPVRALSANIALEMSYATGTHRAGLFASGLLLTLLVLGLMVLAVHYDKGQHRELY